VRIRTNSDAYSLVASNRELPQSTSIVEMPSGGLVVTLLMPLSQIPYGGLYQLDTSRCQELSDQNQDLRVLLVYFQLATPPMATAENTINDALAELLKGTRRAWRDSEIVSSENTGQLKGSTARPDILVVEPNVSPVVIETEVLPAVTVEAEGIARLGAQLKKTGRTILSSIGVRLPLRLREKSGKALQKELLGCTDLEMALFTGSGASAASRFPHTGWMVGTVADLSILTQAASVPPDVIEEAANNLANGVRESAGM
jgi:hypothetical protein